MARARTFVIPYVLSLVVVIALLVMWIIWAVTSGSRLSELAHRVGATSPTWHWIILGVGCGLLGLLIVFITHQLAGSLAEYRYARKQEEFVSSITHEMKSPLAAIRLHAQTLQQDVPEGQEMESVEYILSESDRLGRLIDNVLESSRLVARKQPLQLVEIELTPFLAGFFSEIRPRLEGSGVELELDITTRATVEATEDGLARVLTNLIDNALGFSARGGRIRCRAADVGSRVRLSVEDEGQGIPKSEIGRIFDRFYSGRDQSSGSGLGLFIVSQLVTQMHGSVRAASLDDRSGAVFVVELPKAGEAE
ncbi:MAG: HAMP domain-containing sensor histidine kinase [Thermoanaerobaculales bacterium]|jgi:signal transduction histidine kinase|nr:HAMP domain-containing sensor histidine kinase [Thermoanaerobaculales bacterium]